MKQQFFKGLKDGVPIFLGYFSVSFGFGILCINLGLSIAAAVSISLTNLTSAGQVAGVGIIAAGGTLIEMALAQLVINLRYSLFGISLSQKLDASFTTPHRIIASFGITDEIFAVAISGSGKISAKYMAGLIALPIIGWTSGTFLGAVAGSLLPQFITNAMGILLYGMFIAIFTPAAKKEKGVLAVVVIAAVISVIFKYLLSFISSGFAIILTALIAATFGAIFFPKKEETE